MWTVVYLAQGKQEADKVENALIDRGVLVKIKSIGRDKKDNSLYQILVPNGEIEEASNVLTSMIY